MTGVLTLNEYQAIAGDLALPDGVFIDGKSMSPPGDHFDALNPANGRRLASLPACDGSVVDQAVRKASWRAGSPDGG